MGAAKKEAMKQGRENVASESPSRQIQRRPSPRGPVTALEAASPRQASRTLPPCAVPHGV